MAEFSWVRVAGALLIALLLAAAGYGGYLLATPEVNPETLGAAASAEGREVGAQKGMKAGYKKGYESARDRAHAPAYAAAYKAAYANEFERADLNPRQPIQVPEPR